MQKTTLETKKDQNQDKKPEKQIEEPKKGSKFTPFLWAVIGILAAYNLKVFLDRGTPIEFQGSHDVIYSDNTGRFLKDGVNQLVGQLKTYRSAKNVTILLGFNGVSNFEQILDQLSEMKDIEYLNLAIGNNPALNKTGSQLAHTLKKLKKLTQLQLGLDNILDYPGREEISKAISSLDKLERVKISFINTDFSGNELKALYPLAKAKNLKALDLLLVGCKISAEETNHLQHLLGQLPQLERLNLNLYANKIAQDGAVTLSGGLFQQKQLKEFGIELYFNNITENGTESLMGVVQTMQDLTSLQLGLEFNYIKDEGGILVGKALQDMKHLKHLSVNAATKNFGGRGYEAILNALEKLPPLTSLELVIGVNKCGPRGAEQLKNVLFRHDRLKSLKLNYLENYITDAGANFLAEGILAQKNLEELSVNVNFNSLSDRGALEIAKAVKQAKTPSIIELRVSQNKITDKGAKEIFGIVDLMLKRAEKVEIEFMNTALTNATRDDIVERYQQNEKIGLRINTIPPSNWD